MVGQKGTVSSNEVSCNFTKFFDKLIEDVEDVALKHIRALMRTRQIHGRHVITSLS